jgi:hypothetical protein
VIVLKLELSKLIFFVFIADNLIVMYYPLSNMLYFLLNRVPDWQRTNLVDGETKQTVRCVNDDLEHGSYLYWKGMVEQVTYIYVPHNGYYRTRAKLDEGNSLDAKLRLSMALQLHSSYRSLYF